MGKTAPNRRFSEARVRITCCRSKFTPVICVGRLISTPSNWEHRTRERESEVVTTLVFLYDSVSSSSLMNDAFSD